MSKKLKNRKKFNAKEKHLKENLSILVDIQELLKNETIICKLFALTVGCIDIRIRRHRKGDYDDRNGKPKSTSQIFDKGFRKFST